MNSKLIPLALVAWVGISSPVLALSSLYKDGVADYEAGRYREAVVSLGKASTQEPGNALAHYYLANALVKTGDHEQAAQEYRISYMLDPYGNVSAYCRAALKGYKKELPSADDIQAFRDTVCGADRSVRKSLSQIRKQLDREQFKSSTASETRASEELNHGDYEATKIDRWAKSEIESLYSPQRHLRDPRLLDQEFLKAREQQIRLSAKEDQERVRREARERAERYRKMGEMRQSALDEVARDLERQMTEKPGAGGVRLLAEGTDLYVRRYASVPTSHPLPDARAAVARIYGKGATSEANPNAQLETPTQSVRGKVLN